MEQIISKEELTEIKKIKGEARGTIAKTIGEYVLIKEGEDGLKKLEDLMKILDYPTEYKKINKMNFYPLWFITVSFLATERLFNFTNEDFKKMGEMDVRLSPFLRIFIKYFISLERLTKEAPKLFNQLAPYVEVESSEFNGKEKYSIMRLKNFDISKYHCQYFIGFANTVARMTSREHPTCEETKCPFRGDDCHEFVLRW